MPGSLLFLKERAGQRACCFCRYSFFASFFRKKTGGHPYACYFFAKEVSAETIAGKYPPYSP